VAAHRLLDALRCRGGAAGGGSNGVHGGAWAGKGSPSCSSLGLGAALSTTGLADFNVAWLRCQNWFAAAGDE
jgi:hypothetical protein